MKQIKELFININEKYFYIILSIISFCLSLFFLKVYSFSIFNILFFIFGVCLLLRFFKREYKILNCFPKNKLIIIISIIFIIFISNQYYEHNYIIRKNYSEGKEISDALFVDPIEQEVNLPKGKYDTIGIQFATYKRNNKNATYNISVYQNENLIFIKDFNGSDLKDLEYTKINVGKHYATSKDKLRIIIKPVYADSENCVSVYYNKKLNNINYQIIDNSINIVKEAIIVLFVVIFASINYIINTKQLEPNKVFIILSLYFIPLVFIIPPYDVPDEPVHYMRAYKLSLITNKNKKASDPSTVTFYGPDMKCLAYGQFQNPSAHFNLSKFSSCIKEKQNQLQESGDDYAKNNISFAHPIAHIVPAIGVKIADVFSNSPVKIFMAGRIMNCIVSILGISYAIKKSKSNKLIFLLISTIPMFVQQMVSYSYDSLLNTSCLIATSLTICILCNEKISKKDTIILTMSLTFILCSKSIYGLILLPSLFIRNKKGIKNYFKEHKPVIISILISLVVLLLWRIFGQHAAHKILSNPSSGSNLTYIIHNPVKIFGIAFNTLKINGWFYIQSFFGYFGWFIFKFDNIIYIIYLIMLYILIKNKDTASVVLNKKIRIISICISLIVIAGVFGALYIDWSKYAMKYVDGVQGRYFIPIIPLLLISIIPKKQRNYKIDNNDAYQFANLSLFIYVITLICNIY